MEKFVKLLILEDDMIIAAKISMMVTKLGYEVTGILSRGEEAVLHVQENKPDVILVDIHLKGEMDGIETARQIHTIADIPIIYLTANSDDASFNRAKATHPYAFIPKPFKQLDLQRALELTISLMVEKETGKKEEVPTEEDAPFILSDRIFVKHNDKMVKIFIEDILYIEANRSYSKIFTKSKEYLLAVALIKIEDKLPVRYFLRVHRSYIINLSQVDEVAENHVIIGKKALPMGANLREVVLKRLQTI